MCVPYVLHIKCNFSSALTCENFIKVDVVRQQIIFHNVHDLRECLAAIASDPEATILRHKNRLSLEYDSMQSAGVLQCVAVCCSVCCSVLQCVAVHSLVYDAVQSACVSQGVAVCCSVLQCVAVQSLLHDAVRSAGALQCVAVCCYVLQCIAVRCSAFA